jgi:hypothetical protein
MRFRTRFPRLAAAVLAMTARSSRLITRSTTRSTIYVTARTSG